jgi:nitroreductase
MTMKDETADLRPRTKENYVLRLTQFFKKMNISPAQFLEDCDNNKQLLGRIKVTLSEVREHSASVADQQRAAAKYHARGVGLYSVQDATIACAYAQLAAAQLGLGSVWVGAFDDDAVKRVLKTQADWRPVALLPIGYLAETPAPTSRRPLDELAKEASKM